MWQVCHEAGNAHSHQQPCWPWLLNMHAIASHPAWFRSQRQLRQQQPQPCTSTHPQHCPGLPPACPPAAAHPPAARRQWPAALQHSGASEHRERQVVITAVECVQCCAALGSGVAGAQRHCDGGAAARSGHDAMHAPAHPAPAHPAQDLWSRRSCGAQRMHDHSSRSAAYLAPACGSSAAPPCPPASGPAWSSCRAARVEQGGRVPSGWSMHVAVATTNLDCGHACKSVQCACLEVHAVPSWVVWL